MNSEFSKVGEVVEFLKSKIDEFTPQVGIVLGTGLNKLVEKIDVKYICDYQDIPHFSTSTVEFHKGKLIFGVLSGKNVVVMQGRFHHYEGYTMKQVTFPIRVMKFLGIQTLLVSNAAGGINSSFKLSELMLIKDHINLMTENPLTGHHEVEFGDRWPDLFNAYTKDLRTKAKNIASRIGVNLPEGVYVGVNGPNLETPAEYKFLGIIGADAVGMSTVPEVIVAAQMNLNVLAVSVITDLCYEGELEAVSIEKIIAAASVAEPKLIQLFENIIAELD